MVDRTDIRGISSNISLLFYRGFARSPTQVRNAFPSIVAEIKNNFDIMVKRIKRQPVEAKLLDSIPTTGTGPSAYEQETYIAFDARAERADQALYILKWLLPSAFVMVAASAFIKGDWNVPLEYAALLLLWIAVEIIRKGLFKASGSLNWRAQVFLGTLKGFGIVVGIAIISLVLSDYILPFIERVTA